MTDPGQTAGGRLAPLASAIALVLATAVFWWSYIAARDARAAIPPLPVRGTSLDLAPPAPSGKTTAPRVSGAGTRESPARLPFHLFACPGYDPPDLRLDPAPLAASEMPDTIRPFQGRWVDVEGFLIAVDYDGERVGGCILARYPQGCCFGTVPVLDEWIDVSTDPDLAQDIDPLQARARAIGILDIGEEPTPDGKRVASLYRITRARLGKPEKP